MQNDIYSSFHEAARAASSRFFVHEVSKEGTRSFTYAEVLEEVEALRRYLRGFNLPFGSRVALLSENRHEWIATYMAVVSMGWSVVALDARQTPAEWNRLLRHSEASLLFVSERLMTFLADIAREADSLKKVVVIDTAGIHEPPLTPYSQIMRRHRCIGEEVLAPDLDPSMVASIIYTSGTTGLPKGVMLTHDNLLKNGHGIARANEAPGKIRASIVPLHHSYGFAVFMASLLHRETMLFYAAVDQELIFHSFQHFRPHFFQGIPLFYDRILHRFKQDGLAKMPKPVQALLQRLKSGRCGLWGGSGMIWRRIIFKKIHDLFGGRMETLSSGGAMLESDVTRWFNLFGIPIIEGYGLTETSPLIACNDLRRSDYRVGSVGPLIDGVEVRIENPTEVGIGEICVRGHNVMKGYFRNPEETARVIDRDGWLHTGDLGHRDSDGFLHVTGRLKEMIVTANGKNVYPDDLERVFGKISLVKEICVFGLSLEEGGGQGEFVHVEILPDFDEAKRQGVADVYTVVRREVLGIADDLPEYMRPRSIGFSQVPFPRTATLKVKKHEVKQGVLAKKRADNAAKASLAAVKTDQLLTHPVGLLVTSVLKRLQPAIGGIFSNSHFTYDLGLDSLVTIEFWASLERIYGVSLSSDKIKELREVGQAITYFQGVPGSEEKTRGALKADFSKEVAGWDHVFGAGDEKSRTIARWTLSSYPRLRSLFLSLVGALSRRLLGLNVKGLENLPKEGAYILAPNHECYLDNLFVACVIPKKVQDNMAVVGAKEFFEHLVTRLIVKLCRTIPVDRQNASSSVFQVGAEVLKEKGILLIHPEGTRSPDGQLLPFKRGIALLASHAPCPIVPVFIEGAHEFWPKGRRLPKSRSRITVTIGKPLDPKTLPAHVGEDELHHADRITQCLKDHMVALRDGVEYLPSEAEIVGICLEAANRGKFLQGQRLRSSCPDEIPLSLPGGRYCSEDPGSPSAKGRIE